MRKCVLLAVAFFSLGCFTAAAADPVVYSPPRQGKITASRVNLRNGPDLKAAVVGRIDQMDAQVEVLAEQGGWYKVSYGELQGWIYADFIAVDESEPAPAAAPSLSPAAGVAASAPVVFSPPRQGTLSASRVSLRGGPDLKDPVVGRIEQMGAQVEVLMEQGRWYKVSYGELQGWIYADFITVDESAAPPASPTGGAAAAASGAAPLAAGEAPSPPGSKEAAPEKSEPIVQVAPGGGGKDVSVLVRKIVFTGNTVIDTETLQKVAADFKDRELTLDEMSQLVDLITITYQERGYILARAYLPKQDIQDGILKIAVVEGNIGKIKVTGKTHYDEKLIKRYFESHLKEGVIKESGLEKGLLLTNEIPKLKTNVVLSKGEKPGDVDIVLNTEDSSWLTFGAEVGFDYNNYGTDLTSKDRYGTTIRIMDHRWGSVLNFRGVIGNNVEDSALGAIDFTLPVGGYGTKISAGYLQGNYIVGQNFADLGLDGDTIISNVKIMHPLITKKNENLTALVGYEHKYTKNFILGQERSIDEDGVMTFSLSYDNLDRFLGKNILSASASFGQVNRDDRVATSRLDEDEHFERYNVSLARVQKVYGYTNLFLRASGQLSNDRLLPIEEFVLGGYGSVRGYAPSLYLGDSGYTFSGELLFAPPYLSEKTLFGQRIAQLAQLAVFYDTGRVYFSEPQPSEVYTTGLSSWGVGVRLFYKDRFSFRYDFGVPIIRLEGEDPFINYFQFSVKFF
jgi:hemolysin activation/secretion protein/uncharacterized protein YraI